MKNMYRVNGRNEMMNLVKKLGFDGITPVRTNKGTVRDFPREVIKFLETVEMNDNTEVRIYTNPMSNWTIADIVICN